jgi:hypothetical protein
METMFEFLMASENLPFTIALGLMVGLGVLEGVATLMGMGVSGMLDSLLPEFDVDIDLDLDALGGAADGLAGADADGMHVVDAHAHSWLGALSRLLGWLHIGRVPILMLLVLFLLSFGLLGLVVQSLALNTLQAMLPAFIACVPAFVGGILFVRGAGGILYRVMPRDETDAVSEQTFVGRVARITLGTARHGFPAQARLRDQHGQTHYVMVEPDDPMQTFTAGADVLLVRRASAVFFVIPNTSESMVDSAS